MANSVCQKCFHAYVCDEYNADRNFPHTVCAYANDHFVDADRLAEICAAEKDGRCVVLPCKVGDTVYYPYAGRVIPKRITQYREILRKSEAIDRWYCLEFSNDKTFDADGIGKTVFLTRSEAVAAMKGGGESKQLESVTPCDVCRYNPPSSCDGKPCIACPASAKEAPNE